MMSRTHCCLCAATSVAAARTKSSFIISLRPYVAVPSALGEVGWGGKLSSSAFRERRLIYGHWEVHGEVVK